MMKTLFDLAHDKFGTKTIFHVIMGLIILIVGALPASVVGLLPGASVPS